MVNKKLEKLINAFVITKHEFYINPNFYLGELLVKLSKCHDIKNPYQPSPSKIIETLLKITIELKVPIRITNVRFNKVNEIENQILNTDPTPMTIVENSDVFENGEFCFTVDVNSDQLNICIEELSLFSHHIHNKLWIPICALTTKNQFTKAIDFITLESEINRNMCVFYLWDSTLQFGVTLNRQRICNNTHVMIKNISHHWLSDYKPNQEIINKVSGKDIYTIDLDYNVTNFWNEFKDILNTDPYMSFETILNEQWYILARSALTWAIQKCNRLRNYDKVEEYLNWYEKFHHTSLNLEYFFDSGSYIRLSSEPKNHQMIFDSCFYCIAKPNLTDIELANYEMSGKTKPMLTIPIYMLDFRYMKLLKNKLPKNLQEIYGEW